MASNEQIITGIKEVGYKEFMRAQAENSLYLADIAENTRKIAEKDILTTKILLFYRNSFIYMVKYSHHKREDIADGFN